MTNANHILLANQLRNLGHALRDKRKLIRGSFERSDYERTVDAIDRIADEIDPPFEGDDGGSSRTPDDPDERGRGLEP